MPGGFKKQKLFLTEIGNQTWAAVAKTFRSLPVPVMIEFVADFRECLQGSGCVTGTARFSGPRSSVPPERRPCDVNELASRDQCWRWYCAVASPVVVQSLLMYLGDFVFASSNSILLS